MNEQQEARSPRDVLVDWLVEADEWDGATGFTTALRIAIAAPEYARALYEVVRDAGPRDQWDEHEAILRHALLEKPMERA